LIKGIKKMRDTSISRGSRLVKTQAVRFVLLALTFSTPFHCVDSLYARAPQTIPLDQLDAPVGGASTDKFGQSISMNTDFGAVGTPGLNVTVGGVVHLKQGGVHIYNNAGNGIFNFQGTLTPSNGTANDGCGMSVAALPGWVVAGAPGRNIVTSAVPPNQLQAGIVWVWRYGAAGWEFPPFELQHPDPKSIDLFGSSVALSQQSVDGIVRSTIVVGAPGDNVIYTDCGSVCVFEWNLSSQQWDRTAFISPPTIAGEGPELIAYGLFGSSVAISGDYMVIGAKRQTLGVSKQGTAFVFRRNTLSNPAPNILQINPAWGDWVLVQRLAALTPLPDEAFGTSVSLSAWNLCVGAPGGSTSAGSASIYDLDNSQGKFVFDAQLFAVSGHAGDQFGASVVLKSSALLIGAPGVDAGAGSTQLTNRGLAYVFTRDSTSCQNWEQGLSYFPPPNANVAEAAFGSAIDLTSGDVAISSPKGDNQQLGQGVVFTFVLNTISCPTDLSGDGGVSAEDILILFSHWGGCGSDDQVADYNNDGCVNGVDLTFLFEAWGACICGG
jgi:hypothetical protein